MKKTNYFPSDMFRAGQMMTLCYFDAVSLVAKREIDASLVNSPLVSPHLDAKGEKTSKHCHLLSGCLIEVDRRIRVQAAGEKTWQNWLAKQGRERTPSTRKPWYETSKDNDCIVQGISENTLGKRYLRCLPKGVDSETYYVNGQPATSEQVAIIRAFKEHKSGSTTEFLTMPIDTLQNVIDVVNAVEVED
jgi:hypothetical protein